MRRCGNTPSSAVLRDEVIRLKRGRHRNMAETDLVLISPCSGVQWTQKPKTFLPRIVVIIVFFPPPFFPPFFSSSSSSRKLAVSQTIALRVSPTARNSLLLISAFLYCSKLLLNMEIADGHAHCLIDC